MSFDLLVALAKASPEFAEAYVRIVEELMKRGVSEADARGDATSACCQALFAEIKGREPWE